MSGAGRIVLAAIAAALVGSIPARAATVSPPSPECTPRSAPISQAPAKLASETIVPGSDGRLLEIVLHSPAMGTDVHNYVLLPANYDASGRTRYPVLYLLHGSGGSYKDWADNGVEKLIDSESATDHLAPFITVMPDGGSWGYYSDWYGTDVGSASATPPPAYATYDIHELIPWIDSHLPARSGRRYRAIAGLSMGGFGSMSYAARYPDLFGVAGSFSGAVDTDLWYPAGSEVLNGGSPAFTDGPPDECVWGDPVTDDVNWRETDPTYLATNLDPVSLFVASGNGLPGPYDTPTSAGTYPAAVVESFIWQMNQKFAGALDAAEVPYTSYFYGPGTHAWPYWLRDLQHFLPLMQQAFRDPAPAPPRTTFAYRSDLTAFSIWGWRFSASRPATEFTYLTGVGRGGLSAIGSGTLRVVTAALYRPRTAYAVTVATSTAATTHKLRSDAAGRLRFAIDLGPGHTVQQLHFEQSGAPPARWQHVHVTIGRAAR